jgi:DNA excision repair protein ERCC-4
MAIKAAKPQCVAIVDTREPPDCAWRLGLPTVRAKLDSGDYSFRGAEHTVAIERKTLSDWIGSLTFGRARFEREMDRLASYARAVIVVEATLDQILHANWSAPGFGYEDHWRTNERLARQKNALRASTASISARWGVDTQFPGDRAECEAWATTWLLKCWKHGEIWRPKLSRFRRRAA